MQQSSNAVLHALADRLHHRARESISRKASMIGHARKHQRDTQSKPVGGHNHPHLLTAYGDRQRPVPGYALSHV